MTNYEWLVKNDMLDTFIADIRCYPTDNPRTCGDIEFLYSIKIEWGESISETIAKWLQAEHPTQKYVLFNDVMNCLSEADKKFNGAAVVHSFVNEVISKLESIEIKEIEE